MDFYTGQNLLDLCLKTQMPISAVMKQRELTMGTLTEEEIDKKLETVLEIIENSSHAPIKNPGKSMGGLIGGEAKKLQEHSQTDRSVTGAVLSKAMAYSMAVLEVNASMGLIVAAPTAGSSGVLPGILMALKEERRLTDTDLYKGLLNASAVGYL